MFRIESDQVLSLLGLQPRDGFRYSIAEFGGREKLTRFVQMRSANASEHRIQAGDRAGRRRAGVRQPLPAVPRP